MQRLILLHVASWLYLMCLMLWHKTLVVLLEHTCAWTRAHLQAVLSAQSAQTDKKPHSLLGHHVTQEVIMLGSAAQSTGPLRAQSVFWE